MDDNFEPPHLEDFDSQEEEEVEEESPHTRPFRNPLEDPAIRHQLRRAILQEHMRQSGETPWNNLGRNVPTEDNTGVRVAPEWPPQVNLACDQRVPTAQPDVVNKMAEHQQKSPQQSHRHKDKTP